MERNPYSAAEAGRVESPLKGANAGAVDGFLALAAEGPVLLVEVVLAIGDVVDRVGLLTEGLVAHLAIVALWVPALAQDIKVLSINVLPASTTAKGILLGIVSKAKGLAILLFKARLQDLRADVAFEVLRVPGGTKGINNLASDQLTAMERDRKK